MTQIPMPVEYAKAHQVCPKCGAEKYSKQLMPPKVDGDQYLEDSSKIECLRCGWKGIGHDLVPLGSVQFVRGTDVSVYSIYQLIEKTQGKIAADLRVMLGEAPMPSTAFSEASSGRRVTALQQCATSNTTDEERHAAWMKMHVDSGWVYGETFDEKLKTHPNLMPWNELSVPVQTKARVFAHMAQLAAEIVKLF